jgi:hypothetical protein
MQITTQIQETIQREEKVAEQLIEIQEAPQMFKIFGVLAKFTDFIEISFFPKALYTSGEIAFMDESNITLHKLFLENVFYTKAKHLDFPVRAFIKQLKKELKDRKIKPTSISKFYVYQREEEVLISIPGLKTFVFSTKLNANSGLNLEDLERNFGFENRSVLCKAADFAKILQKFKNKEIYYEFMLGTTDNHDIRVQTEIMKKNEENKWISEGIDEAILELEETFEENVGPKLFSADFIRDLLPIAKISRDLRIHLEDIRGQPMKLEFDVAIKIPYTKSYICLGTHEIYIACRGDV